MFGYLTSFLEKSSFTPELKKIEEKVFDSQRISIEEGVLLYEQGELGFLGTLANYIREKRHGDYVYFNRNFHVEPTNICVFDCKFCSYSRLMKEKEEGWELSEEQILDKLKSYRFPGNVRELENMLERAYTLCENEHIQASDLRLAEASCNAESGEVSLAGIDNLEDYLESVERKLIEQALEETRWNRTAAAERLGMTFRSLRYRLKKLGID